MAGALLMEAVVKEGEGESEEEDEVGVGKTRKMKGNVHSRTI